MKNGRNEKWKSQKWKIRIAPPTNDNKHCAKVNVEFKYCRSVDFPVPAFPVIK